MSVTLAIIDIGTNTFNLLIAKQEGDKTIILHQDKIAVRLGKDGIGNKKISSEAFQRGIEGMITHKKTADKFSCEKIIAVATSMVRDAENGCEFCATVFDKTGISIQVLSGDEEAELICEGVRKAIDLSSTKLIMDIGGGSIEFIIANQEEIFWKKSYDLGITRLFEFFQHSDPITSAEILLIRKFLANELVELFNMIKKHSIIELVGSAGTFESYASIIAIQKNTAPPEYNNKTHPIAVADFEELANWFYTSTSEQRKEVKGLIELRRNLIVIASILIDEVIQHGRIRAMELSSYALKEGVFYRNFN